MDTGKFIDTVKQFPQVWDRNCVTFREPNLKSEAWERIGERMGCAAATAKDTFKSLREKYVREREKQSMFAEKYTPWQYMKSLAFLDPHIILRKLSLNSDTQARSIPEYCKSKVGTESFFAEIAENYGDFDKTLISLVKKASPIWDRKSNEYPSKQVKFQLWKDIAQVMNKDVNACMMRWKGLREKYIRQKNKYQEGEGKWQFLDDMSFLDKVIQYRRKHYESDVGYRQNPRSDFHFQHDEFYEDNSVYDSSSNEFTIRVKSEDDLQDSYEDASSSGRKRSTDDISEASFEKRPRYEEETLKSPERMFGELVAAMLAKKTEKDRNVAMIEIMKVLTK